MQGRRFELGYTRFNRTMMGVLGVGPRWSYLELTDHEIVIRMGWSFAATIPLAHVRSVAAAERPFIGWGVHGWRGRWFVNGSMQGVVSVGIDPPARAWVAFVPIRLRTLFISLADAEAFLHAYRQRVSPSDSPSESPSDSGDGP